MAKINTGTITANSNGDWTSNAIDMGAAGSKTVYMRVNGTEVLTRTFTATAGGSTPTAGIGQATTNNANFLLRWNGPTFTSFSVCGYYYNSAQVDTGTLFSASDSGGATITLVFSGTGGVLQTVTSNGYTYNTVATLSTGTWYFWALTHDGTTLTAWVEQSGTALSGGGTTNSGVAAGTVDANRVGFGVARAATAGYHARIRSWSSVLTLSELNAERTSATIVKAGSYYDAPLTSTSDLGGFSMEGTLTAGP
jgi:hypothetical protein